MPAASSPPASSSLSPASDTTQHNTAHPLSKTGPSIPCASAVCVQVCTGWRDAHDAALPALEPNDVPPDAAAASGSRNLSIVRTLRLGAGAMTTTSAAGVRIPPTFDLYAWVRPDAIGRLMFLAMLTRLELCFVDKPITDAWVSSLPNLPHFSLSRRGATPAFSSG